MTVAELGPAWLSRRRGHLKPSAFRSYESTWRVHVAPRWAEVRIGDVRFSDVQSWLADLSGERGAVIVRFAHAVLARILDDCVRDRQLTSNPARGVKLPPKFPRKNVYLTADQLVILGKAAMLAREPAGWWPFARTGQRQWTRPAEMPIISLASGYAGPSGLGRVIE